MTSIFTPFQRLLITWLLILVSGWLTIKTLSYVGDLISLLLTAALIAFLLNYAVKALKQILPRPLAVVIVYLGASIVLVLIILTLLPPVFTQGKQLITRLPELLAKGQQQLTIFQVWSAEHNLPFNVQIITSQLLVKIQAQAENITSTGFGLVIGTFNGLLEIVLILVISFYMLLDGKRLWNILTGFFSPPIQQQLTLSLNTNLNRFVTGQLLLGLFMAISLSFSFRLLQVPFFLLFAIFIGLMEIIPFIGATLGISTVVIVVAFLDFWLALKVLAISLIFQQLKDNLIAPRIMGNLTGLSPVIIFICLLLGAKVGGFLGIILAIPLTGAGKSLTDVLNDPNLPPQTGAFFHNPLKKTEDNNEKSVVVEQN